MHVYYATVLLRHTTYFIHDSYDFFNSTTQTVFKQFDIIKQLQNFPTIGEATQKVVCGPAHCKNVWITSTCFGYLSCIEQHDLQLRCPNWVK